MPEIVEEMAKHDPTKDWDRRQRQRQRQELSSPSQHEGRPNILM